MSRYESINPEVIQSLSKDQQKTLETMLKHGVTTEPYNLVRSFLIKHNELVEIIDQFNNWAKDKEDRETMIAYASSLVVTFPTEEQEGEDDFSSTIQNCLYAPTGRERRKLMSEMSSIFLESDRKSFLRELKPLIINSVANPLEKVIEKLSEEVNKKKLNNK